MSTYTPIASQTLGSAAASVTFSSIPQGYTDLVLVSNFATSTSDYIQIVLNSDTTVSNYSGTYLYGSGTSASSGRYIGANGAYWLCGTPSATTVGQGMARHIFQNYSNSTIYKTGLLRSDTGNGAVMTMAGLWRNTAAINSIKFQMVNGETINAGSTFSIYGIQVGNAAAKAQGGNIVVSDGTYMYHAFTSSGSFIPNEALTADVLLVAGGGAGGGYGGAGGGAGGALAASSQSLTAKSYPVIVGAGGSALSYNVGTSGSNSIFNSNTAIGGGNGGTGGGSTGSAPSNGGSGGGAGFGFTYTTPGTGTAGQGNNGGASSANWCGGGGGAGAVGQASSGGGGGYAGSGGIGIATISPFGTLSSMLTLLNLGASGYIAGGGGGCGGSGAVNGSAGTGGTGGGGAGGVSNTSTGATITNATNGLVNTGGGGGGGNNGGSNTFGATGGSGFVIIRYAL